MKILVQGIKPSIARPNPGCGSDCFNCKDCYMVFVGCDTNCLIISVG